jgi:hypothetical protein
MSSGVRRAAIGALVVAGLSWPAARSSSDTGPSVVAVRKLEMGYRLNGGPLKLRLTLGTGEAVDAFIGPLDFEPVSRIAQLCSANRTAMTATLEDKALVSVQCAVATGTVVN